MLQAKFKIGDKVVHKRTGRTLTVLDCKHNPPRLTLAVKVRTNGALDASPTTISEYWSYKLSDGKAYRYVEELLEHVNAAE